MCIIELSIFVFDLLFLMTLLISKDHHLFLHLFESLLKLYILRSNIVHRFKYNSNKKVIFRRKRNLLTVKHLL